MPTLLRMGTKLRPVGGSVLPVDQQLEGPPTNLEAAGLAASGDSAQGDLKQMEDAETGFLHGSQPEPIPLPEDAPSPVPPAEQGTAAIGSCPWVGVA